MSSDDIVFGDVKYREPIKARRPDRDPKYACLAHGVPGAHDLPIFIDRKAADKIERHALRDTSVELGGIVLGKECVDDKTGSPFVWITEALEAKHYESSEARFKYTHESWEEITRERDRLHPDLDIVGWYHTHPDFGIFLSGLDLYIHENFFNQPLQIAYVVDPIRQTRGFFQWRNGRMESEPIPGFHVVADRGDRVALSRFVNDLEGIANADGGGSGLSPRLEAELIAMLSRPNYAPQSSPYDQARASAVQTLLGVVLGAVAVGAALWINTLFAQIQDQKERIDRLTSAVNGTTEMQRVAFDSIFEKNEAARPNLDFMAKYSQSLKDRDRYKILAEDRLNAVDRISVENKSTREAASKLEKDLAEAKRVNLENAPVVKAAEKLAIDYRKLEEQVAAQNRTIAEYKEVKSAVDLDQAVSLVRKYQTTWWVAAGGWLAAIAAGVGLLALWIAQNPVAEGLVAGPGSHPGGGGPPPSTPSGETHIIS